MPERRNVVVLVLDTLRKDKISVYNDDVDFTPNFESIAEESVVYTGANAQAPWTLPSTASMFTGKYPWEHGATHEKIYLDNDDTVLAEKFQDEGFHTKVISPNTWISPSIGTVDGFGEVENLIGLVGREPLQTISGKLTHLFTYLPENLSQKITYGLDLFLERFVDVCKSRETVEETKNFLSDVDDNEDFFLFVNLMSAHEPYEIGDPPQEYLDRHGVEDLDKVPGTEREFFQSEYDVNEMEKAYDAAVDYTDDLVGEIRDTLRENNLEDDTVLVIVSDHGQAVGKDGIYGHQFTLMDRVIETPMIVSDPETSEAEEKDGLFELRQLYDLVPYLAGIGEEPEEVDEVRGGYEFPESFVGVIPDDKRERFDRKLRYVKTQSQKIVKSTNRSGEDSYQVIDLDTGEEASESEELREKVDRIEDVSADEETKQIEDEEVKKRLEDLGYM